MKLTRKMIPAFIMLLVSAVLLSTSSFAWFSINNQVSAEGVNVKAVAPVNIQISNVGKSSYGPSAIATEAYQGKLFPASSQNGKNFWAVTSGDIANGVGGVLSAGDNSGLTFTSSCDVLGTASAADTGYFQDYTFWVKQSATTEGTHDIYVEDVKLNATAPATKSLEGAIRVAVFSGGTSADDGTLMGIFAIGDASTDNVITDASKANDVKVASLTTTLGEYDAGGTNKVTLTAQTEVRITVRVWIEGQDAACVNSAAGGVVPVDIIFAVHEA